MNKVIATIPAILGTLVTGGALIAILDANPNPETLLIKIVLAVIPGIVGVAASNIILAEIESNKTL